MARQPWKRSFWSLMVTQFQGAFSDNAFKTLVMFLILGSEQGRDQILLVGALFAVPFLLFSMAGGFLADRFSKRKVTIGTKLLEIAVMTLGLVGLASGSLGIKITAVFLMSVQSALFGPTKYGLLPDLLPERRLSWGNGLLQMATFIAIISGTVAGGWMSDSFRRTPAYSGILFVTLGCLGLVSALGIRRQSPADPHKRLQINFLADLAGQLRIIARDRVLWLSVFGYSYFYFLAALLQFTVLFHGRSVLQVSDFDNSLLLASTAVGIGIGSVAAGYLSGGKIEYGLIPLGSLGLTFFGGVLYLPGLGYAEVLSLLGLLGFSAGFFLVPIYSLVQHRPQRKEKGGVIAAANLLSMLGVFLSSVAYYLLAESGLGTREIFLVASLGTLVVTLYLMWLLPAALMRLGLWIFSWTVYSLRVRGRDNIPDKGGALFVSNHLSLVDSLLLIASTDRFIRFLIYKGIYERPYIRPIARLLKTIPISSGQRPRDLVGSLRTASRALSEGEVVCIFAEGQMTRIGQLLPFRRGMERIVKGTDVPIVPVHLDGVWGSIFSFERGRFFWKAPRRLRHRVTVRFGEPLPPQTPAFEVRRIVQRLHSESFGEQRRRLKTLDAAFLRTTRRHPWRLAVADDLGNRLSFAALRAEAFILARRLRTKWQGQDKVAILGPPSAAATAANWAVLLAGKAAVNLDPEAPAAFREACLGQCRIETILICGDNQTVGGVGAVQHVPLPLTGASRAVRLLCWLTPNRFLRRLAGGASRPSADSLATVVFSPDPQGAEPLGVMLSHFNLASNIEQIAQVFFLGRRDRILGVLPFSQAFGFTCTLALPSVLGLSALFCSRPQDAVGVGEMARRYKATLLPASPELLGHYLVGVSSARFGSLQFIVSGGPPLEEELAAAFRERFGLRPLEAYGCNECSPAVAVSTADYRAAGLRQVGTKRGRMGHPLPGLSLKIVDGQGEELPAGSPGRLLIKGPNVMQGYLGRQDRTIEVLKDGWYVSRDLAAVDEDGFLQIIRRV